MQALLLVGHGSPHDPEASAPVRAQVERIRRRRIFHEVRAAYWKEEPPLRDALRSIGSADVFVVPMLLAEGYYTRTVVPRELRLDGSLTLRGARRIHYCMPVGAHPAMADLVLRRALQAAPPSASRRSGAALLVVGHGTERSATSGATVRRVRDGLRERCDFGSVECAFLDEAPRLEDVVERLDARDVVLVPFFLAQGWHTRTTIPHRLGLTGPRTQRGRRTLWYAQPVGTLPQLTRIVLDLARRAGAATAVCPMASTP